MQTVKLEDETAELEVEFADDDPIIQAEGSSIQKVMGAVRSVIDVIPLEKVEFNHLVPPVGIFTHKLKVTLVDGRTATYDFAQTTPIASARYELRIVGGSWNETEALSNVAIKRTILELHTYCHMTFLKWEKK